METLDHLKNKYNLHPIKHWQTISIARAILNNINQDVHITDDPWGYFDTSPQPIDSPEIINQLKDLADQGYQILLETKTNHGDEGGTALIIYLASPETYNHFWEQYDLQRDKGNSGLGFEIEYLSTQREGIKAVWAGPY